MSEREHQSPCITCYELVCKSKMNFRMRHMALTIKCFALRSLFIESFVFFNVWIVYCLCTRGAHQCKGALVYFFLQCAPSLAFVEVMLGQGWVAEPAEQGQLSWRFTSEVRGFGQGLRLWLRVWLRKLEFSLLAWRWQLP